MFSTLHPVIFQLLPLDLELEFPDKTQNSQLNLKTVMLKEVFIVFLRLKFNWTPLYLHLLILTTVFKI